MWNPMASTYHSKIRSTQNKGVTVPFCLRHGLQRYFLMQTGNQKFYKAGEVSWNQDTSINISSKTHGRKALPGKILEFFFQDTVKTTFRLKNLTQRWTQLEFFFAKLVHFFRFSKKDRGGITCFSLSLAILCLLKCYYCFIFLY